MNLAPIEVQPLLPFTEDDEIQRRFLQFHRDNPHVYEKLVELARAVQRAGFRNYGIEPLFARLRWHYDIDTRSTDGFKLNNNYTSRYARLLMEREPDLAGFFRTRTLGNGRGAN